MTQTPSMRERMLAGELYIADDAEIGEESARARWLIHQLNTADPRDAIRLHEIRPSCWAGSVMARRSGRPSLANTGIKPRSERAALRTGD